MIILRKHQKQYSKLFNPKTKKTFLLLIKDRFTEEGLQGAEKKELIKLAEGAKTRFGKYILLPA